MRRGWGGALRLWAYTGASVLAYAALARRAAPAGAVIPAPAPAAEPEAGAPLVSIVLPVRDEARNVRDCVIGLLAQDHPRVEVIVVDDGSRDDTPRILSDLCAHHPRRERLRVVRVEGLPPGWAGKPHALHAGAERARGDWLLFTDADTRHHPGALRAALACACARRLDLLSLATRQELPDFWGRMLMPIAYMGITALYPPRRINDPTSAIALANGQYILIRRPVYDALGGYANPRLRATLLDDRDLAREVKGAGYRLEVADGRALVSTRMYRGLGEHWRGWGKNVYGGSRGGPAVFLLLTAGLFASSTLPFALLLAGVARRRGAWAAAGALQVGALVTYRTRLDRDLGVPWPYAWTHPLGGIVFTGILARAGWRKLTGRGVGWRGRTYRI
jgi:chlorobactene glucosyltransferase